MTNTKETTKKPRRADILLIGGLIIALGIAALVLNLTKSSGDTVIVRVSGEQVYSFCLDEDVDMVIEGKDGGTNRLIISDGKAWLQNATCPDKLCEGMGKIDSSGESVICLPNEVVVEIHGADEDDVDTVAK